MSIIILACHHRTINSRQSLVEGYQDSGFRLMASMLYSNLICPGKEIWNLFLPNFSHPTPSSDNLLQALVLSQGLAENYLPSILGSSGNIRGHKTFPLRCLLINWLLSQASLESLECSVRGLTPERTAKMMYALCVQNPVVMLKSSEKCGRKEVKKVQDLEKLYLKTSFGSKLKDQIDKKTPIQKDQKNITEESNPLIDAMTDHVIKELRRTTQSLGELLEPTVSICMIIRK